MRRPEYEKTCAIFKDTFTDAHQDLRNKETIVDELVFYSSNAIVTQLVEQLRDKIPALEDSPPPQLPAPLASDNLPTVMPGLANVIQQADPSIATLIQTMMTSIEAMRLRIDGNKNNVFNEHGRGCDDNDSYA